MRRERRSICTGRSVSDMRVFRTLTSWGQALATEPARPGVPRLRWPGTETNKTVKSMREGLMGLAKGLNLAVRNVATHKPLGLRTRRGGRRAPRGFEADLERAARWWAPPEPASNRATDTRAARRPPHCAGGRVIIVPNTQIPTPAQVEHHLVPLRSLRVR